MAMATTTPKTYKITLRYQDWQATEDALLHTGKARKLNVSLAAAEQRRDDSVRYETLFLEARNLHHARRIATEGREPGWSVLDAEEMGW